MRPLVLFPSKSLRCFNTVSSDPKLNLNLELGNFGVISQYFPTEGKPAFKEGGGKLAIKQSTSMEKNV